MQCSTLTEAASTQPAPAGAVSCSDSVVRGWTRRIAGAVRSSSGKGASDDTSRQLWDTGDSGADMSSRPIPVQSAVEAASASVEDSNERAPTELAEALRAGDPTAVARLFDKYGKHVERVLIRTIGRDGEMDDMVQDVFLGAYRSGPKYQGNDEQLKAWISRIAVFTARGYLRKRKRRWWLRSADPEQMPELTSKEASPHIQEVLRRTYAAMDKMDPDLRIPLALRELEKLELAEIADACDCSVSTVKRRLNRARKAFDRLAKRDPILRDWLEDEN